MYGFLTDLGQLHYYNSTNPLRTKGPNECHPPASGFLTDLFSHQPFPKPPQPVLGSIKPTIPEPRTTKINQQSSSPEVFNP